MCVAKFSKGSDELLYSALPPIQRERESPGLLGPPTPMTSGLWRERERVKLVVVEGG